MRCLRVVLGAVLAALLAGCGSEPLTPTEDLLPLLAKGGSDRPIKGSMSGLVTFEYDWADPDCPVTTVTDAWGTMSHLGKVYSHWSHCPPIPGTPPGYRNGHMLLTAANGDQIVGEYEDLDGELPWMIEVVGGTGRFAEVHGTIYTLDFEAVGEWGDDGLPIQPWSWWGIVEGSISY